MTIRQIMNEAEEDVIRAPLEPTQDVALMKQINEAEKLYNHSKKEPFCRTCVWNDWNKAKEMAKLDSVSQGKRIEPTLPDVNDEKYRQFEYIGERIFEEWLLIHGTKTKVPSEVAVHYRCKHSPKHLISICSLYSELYGEKPLVHEEIKQDAKKRK